MLTFHAVWTRSRTPPCNATAVFPGDSPCSTLEKCTRRSIHRISPERILGRGELWQGTLMENRTAHDRERQTAPGRFRCPASRRNLCSRSACTTLPSCGGNPSRNRPPGRKIRRKDGYLRIDCQIKSFLGPNKTEATHVPSEGGTGVGEKGSDALIIPVKILTHTGILRSLSRKDKTEYCHGSFPARRFRRPFRSERFPFPCTCRSWGRHGGEAWAHGIGDTPSTGPASKNRAPFSCFFWIWNVSLLDSA